MIAKNEFYFVALRMMDEEEERDIVFPVKFYTRDYKTAVLFTSMLTAHDPEDRLFVCNDVGDMYKVSDKKRA